MKTKIGIWLFVAGSCVVYFLGTYTGAMAERNGLFRHGDSNQTGNMQKEYSQDRLYWTTMQDAANAQDVYEAYTPETENKAVSDEVINEESDDSRAVAAGTETVLNDRTEYLLEEYNVLTGEVSEQCMTIPAEWVGLNRSTLEQLLALYMGSPTSEDVDRGLEGAELRAFSSDRVIIRLIFRGQEDTAVEEMKNAQGNIENEKCYFMRIENDCVQIYMDDEMTLFLSTDIHTGDLDESTKIEILQSGKWITQQELYSFLETYSS